MPDEPDEVLAPFRHPDDSGRLSTAAEMLNAVDFLDANRRLTQHIEAVVRAVIDTEAKGSVTLKFDVLPQDDGTVSFVATVTSKEPQPRVRTARLYHNPKGQLFLHDPMQPTLSADARKI